MACSPALPARCLGTLKRASGPEEGFQILKEMIALHIMLDPATHMSGLRIRTGQERRIVLRDPMHPPDFEPIHQAETGWKRLPAFPSRVGIAVYPGIHPSPLRLRCRTGLMQIVHIVEVVAPELRLGWIVPADALRIIYRVIQERQGCPLPTRRGRHKRDFGRLYTFADTCVLYGRRTCRQVA